MHIINWKQVYTRVQVYKKSYILNVQRLSGLRFYNTADCPPLMKLFRGRTLRIVNKIVIVVVMSALGRPLLDIKPHQPNKIRIGFIVI